MILALTEDIFPLEENNGFKKVTNSQFKTSDNKHSIPAIGVL
jgi:hypothetical protein